MRNILIIDDEDAIVLALSMALSRAGYNVEIATNGIEGVKKFDQGRFGLVITDVSQMMSSMRSFQNLSHSKPYLTRLII